MSSLSALQHTGFDSQLTLVDTSRFGTPHSIVSFIRDDMKNTKIASSDERLLYLVSTDKTTNTHTIVRRGDTEEVVAEIKRKQLRPDTIQFGSDKQLKLSEWLNGDSGKWSDFPVSFEWQSLRYTWKANDARQIALYEEHDQHNPVAWFQTSKKEVVDGVYMVLRALLALQSEALDALDAIVVSLLVVEYNLRLKETRYHNADGRATYQHYF